MALRRGAVRMASAALCCISRCACCASPSGGVVDGAYKTSYSARMQAFRFEDVFIAPDAKAIFDAYFDADFTAQQDAEIQIKARIVQRENDAPTLFSRVTKVVPARQLPSFVRPLVRDELHYIEDLTWFKSEDRLAIVIHPSIGSGRAQITVDYRVQDVGAAPDGRRRFARSYAGQVAIEVPLIGGRIEKGIIEDMRQSLATTAKSTQRWLDQHRPAAVLA